MAEDSGAEVFPADFFARLERVRLRARKVHSGTLRAERRSRRSGSSLEFADYRNYAPGDDLRRVDWGIYGRIERLMTRVYEEEEDLDVTILLDASASMRWESRRGDTASKWKTAHRLAAALAYLGLHGLDRVVLGYFDSTLRALSSRLRGRTAFSQAVEFLRHPPAEKSGTDLPASLDRFVKQARRKGMVIVLSDFLDPHGYEAGLLPVIGRHFSLHVIHLFHPEEIQPRETGDLLLRDSETGEEIAVTIHPHLLAACKREFENLQSGLQTWCTRSGAGYTLVRSDMPLEDVVLRQFRETGLLR